MQLDAASNQTPRLYRDLADWYPLLTPVGDYAEEAAFYRRLFEAHSRRPPRTLIDLGSGGATAFAHIALGGVALFQPDFVSETFEPGVDAGGGEKDGRALRYLEWRWVPDAVADMCLADMAYILRDENGAVHVLHDRHVMGLFPRAAWLELIAAAGFEPLAVPFEHSAYGDAGRQVRLGLRPAANGGT